MQEHYDQKNTPGKPNLSIHFNWEYGKSLITIIIIIIIENLNVIQVK